MTKDGTVLKQCVGHNILHLCVDGLCISVCFSIQ